MKGTGSWNGVESFGNQVLVIFQSRKSIDYVTFLKPFELKRISIIENWFHCTFVGWPGCLDSFISRLTISLLVGVG